MAARTRARVLTYGLSSEADVHACDVSGRWPDRLRMRVRYGAEEVDVQTQLCGTHWTHCALAALATGIAMGIPLRRCAEGLEAAPAFLARMEPVVHADGVTFIRDDWKAPLWTTEASFAFMREAHAARKVVVVGTLSDYGGDASAQYARVARRALEAADHVVFVGDWASRALRAARGADAGRLRAFTHVRDAAEHLNAMLQPGDLVLLKGTNRKDHLLRILLARERAIACWRDDCGKQTFCDRCASREVPSGPSAGSARPAVVAPPAASDAALQAVVGIGNPGERFVDTPHNVGHAVLDRLIAMLDLSWRALDRAFVARTHWKGQEVLLIKLQVGVNTSGGALQDLAEQFGFDPRQSIVVHDDLDLPLGTVRARMRGSAGGHRGVASILDACQSDTVRRVKVGVGRPEGGQRAVEYVLRPFAQADRPGVERACETAAQRVLSLLQVRAREEAPS